MRRAARWLAGSGVFLLPACAALDQQEPVGYPPQPRLSSPTVRKPAPAAEGPLRLASGEGDVVPAKEASALPAVPAAEGQGKPLPIDLPTALALTNANPLDVQIAGERLRAATAQLDRANVLWL